ncbi:MAG: MATE family efflux transporter [Lachnospiraceae bacterium]|nr:MATE family efflux transporter [Lachnospiraceae bacterium]
MEREKTSRGQVDLLNGPIMKSLIWFAVPIFISMLFQQLYNAADTAIVGNILGEKSLAAIGAVSAVFELFLHLATGLCSGFGIVIARAYGSKDEDKLKRSVAGALMIGIGTALLISLLSIVFLKPLLQLINTPEDIIGEALSYIRIVSLFLFVTFTYNLVSGALRAIGNSVLPLIFLIFSSVLNVILDYIFIAFWGAGVQGAAVATVISQAVSAVLCIIYLFRKVPLLIPEPKHLKIDVSLIRELAGQGFAAALMSSLVSISSIILQSGINGLGTEIIAAHISGRKIFFLSAMPFIAMPIGISVFISQNRGAGNGQRILKAMKDAYLFFAAIAAVMSLILWTSAPALIRLISGSDNPLIISNGSRLLYVLGPFLFILGIINTTRHSLQGIGYKLIPVISSLIELAGKVLFVIFLIPRFGYSAVIWCEPSIWVFMAIQLLYAWYTNDYIAGLRKN